MDSLDETTKKISSNMGFFKHVFNFDDDSKSEIMNILQYAMIAIIPIIVLNKSMQKYIPEADEEKGSMELLAEVVIQVVVMFVGILLINRIITYIPTYSGEKYPEFSTIYIILAVLLITLSLQTKLGEKVSILVDRVVELWDGKMNPQQGGKKGGKGKNGGNVKVTQPISGQNAMNQSLYSNSAINSGSGMGNSMGSNSMEQGTSISSLPVQTPDYNNMYQNTPTPLVNAATPGIESMSGGYNNNIMAANDAFGSSFGSTF